MDINKRLESFSVERLKKMGWTIKGDVSPAPKKIIILGPHIQGFFEVWLGLLVSYAKRLLGRRVLIKQEAFFFPVSLFLRWIGAIPVDRKQPPSKFRIIRWWRSMQVRFKKLFGIERQNYVKLMINEINNAEYFSLVITPDGTRITTKKPRPEWKPGFMLIARAVKIPCQKAALDYKNKVVILDSEEIYFSEDEAILQKQLQDIQGWYEKTIPGYSPNINLSKFLEKS